MTIAQPEPYDPRSAPGAVPVLLLLVFLSLIGFGVVIPLLPFFATAFNAPPWQVSLLFATYSAGQFLGELFWGRMSDRIGRRPVLLITIAGSAVGYLALAYAPGIWIAVLARGAAGFFAGNMSAIQGYIVDVSPPQKLAGRLGLIGSAFGVGFVVGPALGGLLARPELGAAGFRPPLLVASGLCLLAIVGILAFVKESRRLDGAPPPRSHPFAAVGEGLRNPVSARAFGVIFFAFFASSSLWSNLGLWLDARFSWGPKEVGLLMAFTGVAAAASQGAIAGYSVRRLGAGATIVIGALLASACYAAMAISPTALVASVLLCVGVVGNALWQPAATSIVSRATHPDRQGAVLGAASASGSLARVAGPIVGGVLFSSVGPWAPLVSAGLWMLPAAWLGWRASQALRGGRDPA
ncbi:MFS transporter [Phenylobacterium sp.]|uniref:MFS transporter n=1 Tax=Phenylobacterium sp. TaxID=1871053 RepID=UPI003BAD42FF